MENVKIFKKKNLLPGMVVETKQGDRFVVVEINSRDLGRNLIGINIERYKIINFKDYTTTLLYKQENSAGLLDIQKVYDIKNHNHIFSIKDKETLKQTYERKEEKDILVQIN